MKIFSNIDELIKFKDKCAFCNSTLKPSLKSYLTNNKINNFNSKLQGDDFTFDIKHTNAIAHTDTVGSINIKTNELSFDLKDSSYSNLIEVFHFLGVHVELTCSNKKCKSNYYVCSNIFNCDESYKSIRPFSLFYESCSFKKYWVQNDWVYNTTKIYSTINSDLDPLEIPFLSFDDYDFDKLKTRILTIVTFS
jgi:hypothetical protein